MFVIPIVSRFTRRRRASLRRWTGIPIAILVVATIASTVFGQQEPPALQQGIAQLDQLLKSGDVEGATAFANSLYEQQSVIATSPPPDGVIIDPVVAAEMANLTRTKAACRIGETFCKHAELQPARHWGETTLSTATCTNQFTRGARVLLGDVCVAMDQDNEAVGWYTGVINENCQNRVQIRAYAGLLDLVLMNKQTDLAEQWVQHGCQKFENAGELELKFLREASRVLKRRNDPLWRELNEQIVDFDPSRSQLHALRELASNARKFGRYAEAETNYTAICAMNLSAAECINNHLFLAECQAKQEKNCGAVLQALTTKSTEFTKSEDREYATYRIAKFYESQNNLSLAATNYLSLATSSSTSTWAAAAMNRLAALSERQGDLPRALQLYLEYPQRFAESDRHVMQAYAGALSVAEQIGDSSAIDQVMSAIAGRAATVQDYNTHLNLAFHYKGKGQRALSQQFLQSGIALAQQTLNATTDPDERVRIHMRVSRRLSDTGKPADGLAYLQAHEQDLIAATPAGKADKFGCYFFWIRCLWQTGRKAEAITLSNQILPLVSGDRELEAMFVQNLGYVHRISGDTAGAEGLYQWLDENYPNHLWSNPGRIRLAEKQFNEGHVQNALELADKVIASTPQNSKMWWIANLFNEATYVRGRSLIELGRAQEGQRLVQEALQSNPGLGLARRLRQGADSP